MTTPAPLSLEIVIREARLAGIRDAQNLVKPKGYLSADAASIGASTRAEQAYYNAYANRVLNLQTMALNALHVAKTRVVKDIRFERVNALTKLSTHVATLDPMRLALNARAADEELRESRDDRALGRIVPRLLADLATAESPAYPLATVFVATSDLRAVLDALAKFRQ